MNALKCVALASVLGLSVCGVPATKAGHYSYRQYYGNWNYYPSKSYYYRPYYYKPYEDYTGYKHHYVVYYPSKPKYYYYYNPYEKKYWGRCPSYQYYQSGEHYGQEYYSLLAPEDRRGNIEDIPENKFPPMAKMPPIPDAQPNDKTRGPRNR